MVHWDNHLLNVNESAAIQRMKKKLLFPKDKQAIASECYKDFVSKMLVKNPFERMTIVEALRHPCIKSRCI